MRLLYSFTRKPRTPVSCPRLYNSQLGTLAIEWGSDRKASVLKPKADSFTRLAADTVANGGVEGGKMAHSLRSIGSAALNFAMVAQGGLDLYWYVGFIPRCREVLTWHDCVGRLDAGAYNRDVLARGRLIVGPMSL